MVLALSLVAAGAVLVVAAALVALWLSRQRLAAALAQAETASAAAAGAERRRREILHDLPFVALLLDGGGRLLEANRAAMERFPFLIEGMRVLEAFSEHRLAERVETALERLERQVFEVRLFAGGRRTYRATIDPYEIGESREALLFLTDASEAVAYQELRSQFVANVSHELRTPLTGLRALLEALDDESMDEETRRNFVGRAARETTRLEALIADILFLSELESTQGLPSSSSSDLASVAATVIEELEELAEEQGVELTLEAPEQAWVPLSERMAHTVVHNLLENAAKYAGPGAVAQGSVRVDGDEVVLRVTDDGVGIPEKHLPHVFERFYRADPSRSKRLGGTGLGLSIVKHISEGFGGRAEASSREGFGTVMTVRLPRVPAPGGSAPEAEPAPADAQARGN